VIDQLKVFFTVNDSIVHFVHGQVFFLLAVMMGVQWFMQRSRLELSRALPWLAAFGALEAIAVWGNAFIPLQQRLLPPDTIQNLRFLQLLVHLLTFATLLGFSLRLSEPAVPSWAAVYVPLVVVLVATAILATNRALTSGVDVVNNAIVEALLRYSLCLPSALLVAYGLRLQAGRLVGPLKNERLINVLRVAGFGFIFYALFEGVLVPTAPFFPANTINTERLFEVTGVPIGIYRSIVGAVIAAFLFFSLDAFRIEADRLAETLQRQQSLMAERERISRDLHDGTIQSIYAAGLMIDDARHTIERLVTHSHNGAGPLIERAREQLDAVLTMLNKTNEEIRGYIYDLRRSVAGDEDLARGLLDIVTEFRIRTAIPTDWSVEGCGKITFSPEQRQHIYQIVREALSNIARHASATRAQVELRYDDCDDRAGAQTVRVRISDNGKGIVRPTLQTGRGLLNMRERATLLKADFSLESEPGKGTTVTLVLKAGAKSKS
jgi:signal transduction histidine kinase